MRSTRSDATNTAPRRKNNFLLMNSIFSINPYTMSQNKDFVLRTEHSIMISSCRSGITLSSSRDWRVASNYSNSLSQNPSTCQDQLSLGPKRSTIVYIQSTDFSFLSIIHRNTKLAFYSLLLVTNHFRKTSD